MKKYTRKAQSDGEKPFDVYTMITDKMIALLESGTAPWQKPWKSATNGGQLPANFTTRKTYRGINVFLLACAPYDCPFWLTFRQAKELGGSVSQGQKGYPVVFWNFVNKKNPDGSLVIGSNGKPEQRAFLRYYTVFNMEQTEGIDWQSAMPVPVEPKSEFHANESCDQIVSGMPDAPTIKHGGSRACYSPALDVVSMPERDTFDKSASYYTTLFHELTHSTGHGKRLARKGEDKDTPWDRSSFGDQDYSREELVAEMGAAFLSAHAGIVTETLANSAAYCQHWIARLKGDPKLIVFAAAQAHKAADFILRAGEQEENETANASEGIAA